MSDNVKLATPDDMWKEYKLTLTEGKPSYICQMRLFAAIRKSQPKNRDQQGDLDNLKKYHGRVVGGGDQ